VQAITGGHLPDVFNAVRILSNGGSVQDVEVALLTSASTALKSAASDCGPGPDDGFAASLRVLAQLDARCSAGLDLGLIDKSELQACGVSDAMIGVLRKHHIVYEGHEGTTLSLYSRALQRALQLYSSP
jgi:hypothetical protein